MITTEHKIIGSITVISLVLLGGAIFFLAKDTSKSVPKSELVAQNGLHWHPKVSVYIKGVKQPFSNGIGLSGQVHNPVHTHDDATQDIVHMEFEGKVVTKEDTTLAKFFQIWGKEFNKTQLFDKKVGPEGTVKMLVNGKINNEYENYLMRDGDNIEIRYE